MVLSELPLCLLQISNLEEQLEQFREELENKSEEVQQLHMQLEIQRKELSSQQQELQHKADLQKVRLSRSSPQTRESDGLLLHAKQKRSMKMEICIRFIYLFWFYYSL